MSVAPVSPRMWLRLPRRTARFRLTALYGGLFLVSGAALLAATYALFERATKYKLPHLPKIPGIPAIQNLLPLPSGTTVKYYEQPHQLALAQTELSKAQNQLHQLGSPNQAVFNVGPIRQLMAAAQRELATAEHQLSGDVHQITHSGAVQAAQRAADSHQLLVNSGIALALVAILAILAGWLLAGRMLRPIRTITRTARRISSASLHERLALEGPTDEFKELGDTLDELFERLDVSFEAQRQFVASASHELRTPMTVERTLLQVALDNPDMTTDGWRTIAKDVLASTEEQARLIEGLLTLASGARGLQEGQSVDLATMVAVALTDLQPEIDRRRIHVDVETNPVHLNGDPLLVERLVVNLLRNAVRHNIEDGRVNVITEMRDGNAVLMITNSGPHIPSDAIERLFQPFQRLDPSRLIHQDGHGLGLSIVRAVANAHDATVIARPMPDGGLSITVAFAPMALSESVMVGASGNAVRSSNEEQAF